MVAPSELHRNGIELNPAIVGDGIWPKPSPTRPVSTSDEIASAVKKLTIAREAHRIVKEQHARELLAANQDSAVDGASFLDTQLSNDCVWGSGNFAPWATNQGFMMFADDGAGKSSLIQQIVFARLALRDASVLGSPVAQDERPILYLALDRPIQIQRSMMRMVDSTNPKHRKVLSSKLVVWDKPLPFDCDEDPELFAQWCVETCKSVCGSEPGLIVGDSVKDMVSSCKEDVAGMGFNKTVQHLVSSGIEFGCCHHNRKEHALNKQPRKLADVYGSRFLTAGLGSVLNIWKLDNGHRELTQLKAPYGNPINPTVYQDDYSTGVSQPRERADEINTLALALVSAGVNGLTDPEAVMAVFQIAAKHHEYKAHRQKIWRLMKKLKYEATSDPFERTPGVRDGTPAQIWRARSADYEQLSDPKPHQPAPLARTESKARAPGRAKAKARRDKLCEIVAEIDGQIKDLDDSNA